MDRQATRLKKRIQQRWNAGISNLTEQQAIPWSNDGFGDARARSHLFVGPVVTLADGFAIKSRITTTEVITGKLAPTGIRGGRMECIPQALSLSHAVQ